VPISQVLKKVTKAKVKSGLGPVRNQMQASRQIGDVYGTAKKSKSFHKAKS